MAMAGTPPGTFSLLSALATVLLQSTETLPRLQQPTWGDGPGQLARSPPLHLMMTQVVPDHSPSAGSIISTYTTMEHVPCDGFPDAVTLLHGFYVHYAPVLLCDFGDLCEDPLGMRAY